MSRSDVDEVTGVEEGDEDVAGLEEEEDSLVREGWEGRSSGVLVIVPTVNAG